MNQFFRLSSYFALATLVAMTSCRSPQVNDRGEYRDIKLAVLSDMVRSVDTTGEVVRFVDLTPVELERLKSACGPKYSIFPLALAELKRTEVAPATEVPVFHLRTDGREGELLSVDVGILRKDEAEASGSFESGSSTASFYFKLRYLKGSWVIISRKPRAAS